MSEPVRRRRRVRTPEATAQAAQSAQTEPIAEETPTWPAEPPAPEPDLAPTERGLRGLVGGGSSQVRPAAAMRARDAARARPEDLARAEAELVIVRRNWTPDPRR